MLVRRKRCPSGFNQAYKQPSCRKHWPSSQTDEGNHPTKTLPMLLVLLAFGHRAAHAQTTAFKSGERTHDGVKDCFYSALGQDYVYTVKEWSLCPLSMPVSTQQSWSPTPSGMTGFKVGEVTRDGVKDCYYSALGQ